jgi:hypothetical protein
MTINKRLYVIGNGFDLHHKIKSSYWDFKDFVKENYDNLFEALEKYFNEEELWSDFEQTLEYLDTDKIIDEASNYLVSYGADDWSDAYHHDYQYEIQNRIDIITEQLKIKFTEWILQLDIHAGIDVPRLKLINNANYLTFNYTPTLEILYSIPAENIFYIHNKIVDKDSNFILGHSRKPSKSNSLNSGMNLEDQDVRVIEGNEILDKYFIDTYKSTETIIKENESFFSNLSTVEEIFVLGHSLSPVDIDYFNEIIKNIDVKKVKWKVSYNSNKDLEHHLVTLTGLGIEESLIHLDKLENL